MDLDIISKEITDKVIKLANRSVDKINLERSEAKLERDTFIIGFIRGYSEALKTLMPIIERSKK